ncbi:MAG: ABC transporter permease [Promethearchaeota archaeon]
MSDVDVKKPENQIINEKKKKSSLTSETKFAMKIMIPAVIVFLFGILFPLIMGILISFTDSSGVTGYFGSKVTLLNYYELLFYGGINALNFWQYTYQTLFFAIFAVLIEFGLGLVFALLLNKEFKGRGLARATLLIPWALPTIASATIFRYEFLSSLSEYGVFNSILSLLGLQEINFFGADALTLFSLPAFVPFAPFITHIDISFTMISCIFIDVWKTTPFFSLLILAALQVVPDDLYKAADIAGATGWQKFKKITWPMIKPGVGIALVFRMMDAIRVYDAVVIFRDESVKSMTMQAVDFWSRSQRFGLSSTVAILEFVLIIIFAILITKLTSRKSRKKSKKKKFEKKLKVQLKVKQTPSEKHEEELKIQREIDLKEKMSENRDNDIKELEEIKKIKVSPVLKTISPLMIRRYKTKRKINKVIFVILIVSMCLFCALPFIWIVTRALRDPYIAQTSFEFLPKFPSLAGFEVVLGQSDLYGVSFSRALLNGFILAGTTGLVVLIVGSLTGYALAKFNFPAKNLAVLTIFTMTSMPALIIVIPYFIQMKSISNILPFFDLTDNLLGLVLPYTAFNLPLATFVLRGFFEEIPEDLWKAAKVDGASNFQVFWKVILPLAIPGLFTCFILVFIAAWNELLFAQIWLISDENHTVPRAILRFVQNPLSLQADWNTDLVLMAATSISTVPLVIIVLIFQKQIIKGITSGAVKG